MPPLTRTHPPGACSPGPSPGGEGEAVWLLCRGASPAETRGVPRPWPHPQAGQAGGAGGSRTGLRGRGAQRCSGVARQPPRASPVSGLRGVEEPQCQELGWPLAKAAGGECVPYAPGSPERTTLCPLSCCQGKGPGALPAA